MQQLVVGRLNDTLNACQKPLAYSTGATTLFAPYAEAKGMTNVIVFPGNRVLSYPVHLVGLADALEAVGGKWGRSGDVVSPQEEKKCEQKASLVYGELHPEGVSKLLSRECADASCADTLLDLGAGKGRLILQAFLTFPNLKKAIGVEFSPSRFKSAVEAMMLMATLNPHLFVYTCVRYSSGVEIAQLETRDTSKRVMQMRLDDLFNYADIGSADIIICETDIPIQRRTELSSKLTKLKLGARLILYHSLYTLPCTFAIKPPASSDAKTSSVQIGNAISSATFTRNTHTALFRTSWTPQYPIQIWHKTT